MSKDYKWSETPDRERWVTAWGTLWRQAVMWLGFYIVGTVIILLLAAIAGGANAAQPAGFTISIPEQPPYPHGPEGSVHLVATFDPATVGIETGWQCDIDVGTSNSDSTHPNTDVIVTSNGDQVVAFDVEDGEGATHDTRGSLTIGDIVRVSVRLGADGVSSLGMEVIGVCQPPTTSTTTTVASTTTTVPGAPTTTTKAPAPTTTLSPPPEGGVPAGGGGCADGACEGGGVNIAIGITIGAVVGTLAGLGFLAWRASRLLPKRRPW